MEITSYKVLNNEQEKLQNFLESLDCGEVEIIVKYNQVTYKLLLFDKALFKLPHNLGQWLFSKNNRFVVRKYGECTFDESAEKWR